MKRILLLLAILAATTACGVESRSEILIPTMPGAIPGVQVEPVAAPTSAPGTQNQEPVH